MNHPASFADLREITAAVLAGGMGTRLRAVVPGRQKVVAEINGRPFLLLLLEQLAAAGVRRAVLCTGHMAEQVETLLGPSYKNLRLSYSREESPLGTGGALRHALPRLDSGLVLAMNGDSFVEADLRAFAAWHRQRGGPASLLLARVPDAGRYGQITLSAQDEVVRFDEKGASAGPGWINAGVYLLDREIIAALPEGRPCSLERGVFPGLTDGRLCGWRGGGRFIDIGTPESYQAAEPFFRALDGGQTFVETP